MPGSGDVEVATVVRGSGRDGRLNLWAEPFVPGSGNVEVAVGRRSRRGGPRQRRGGHGALWSRHVLKIVGVVRCCGTSW